MASEQSPTLMDGIINLDKPVGPSSAAAVTRIKHLLPEKSKIGHAGTLDPFASGVLVILIGKATRLSESLMNQPKSYLATIQFGATTATDDPESTVTPVDGAIAVNLDAIISALPQFIGSILQRPPAFSAMKIGGRRAYDLARRGRPVELAARPVRIDAIEILTYQWPALTVKIDCGRGTYIRSIARDLGQTLGVGGYLTQLRRLCVGQFSVEDAVKLESLTASNLSQSVQPLSSLTCTPRDIS